VHSRERVLRWSLEGWRGCLHGRGVGFRRARRGGVPG
jgi:hypothetical protein